MQVHRIDLRRGLPQHRQRDAEQRQGPSGSGVVLAVLVPLIAWAMLATLGVHLW